MKTLWNKVIIICSALTAFAMGCENDQSGSKSECSDNETRCSDDHLGVQVCKDGTWSEAEPCSAAQTCDEQSHACREPAGSDCKEKETKCAEDANGYLTCANGRWSESAVACKFDETCSHGRCEHKGDSDCTQDEKKCSEDGHRVLICDATGQWKTQKTCDDKEICNADQKDCVSDEDSGQCSPEEKKCSDDKRQVMECNANGHWENGIECKNDEICDPDQKECISSGDTDECTESDKKCTDDGRNVMICNAEGHWDIETECNTGETCSSEQTECIKTTIETECTAGEKKCSQDNLKLLTCDAEGHWDGGIDCKTDEICDPEQKTCIPKVVPPECTSGQKKCSGDSGYLTCNAEGHWSSEVTSCKFQETCKDDGKCIKQKDKVDFGIWYSTWYAYTKETSTSNRENTWTAWDIPYRPKLSGGNFGMYDSKDAKETEYYISQISDAGIDFIILDQTNNIDVDGGYINERSLATAEVCKKYIDGHPDKRPVRYCSAIGGIQWSQDPATIEAEAKKLWERYDSGEAYHYYLDGKPLLIVYIGNLTEDLWKNYQGDKTYASKYTIRFADNASRPGYYGWAYDKGTQLHSEVSVIMPGWDNRKGAPPVKRNAGDWYQAQLDVLRKAATLPKLIVINSFNEYAEGTAVWSANTDLPGNSDKWVDKSGQLNPDMYWNMTVDFIKEIRKK